MWKELQQENNLELVNGTQGVMTWVFHVEVQPPEFYPSSNRCLKEELMQVRHQGLASGEEEHSVLVHLLEEMRERRLDLADLKWEEKPDMMMREQDW